MTIDGRPALPATWVLTFDGYDEEHQRVEHALLSLAGAGIGTSGGPLLTRTSAERWVVAAGVYDGNGPETHLLAGPVLTGLAVAPADANQHRALDLRGGVLHERTTVGGRPVEMVRFVSVRRPGIVAVRTFLPDGIERDGAHFVTGPGARVDEGASGKASWKRVAGSAGGIVAAAREAWRGHVVDDFVAIVADPDRVPEPDEALRRLDDAVDAGFDVLLSEQNAAWRARWEDADVVIEGDDELQLATRVALFHLMAAVTDTGEAAVGARGLSGTGYRGHVFWDADTFVMPFLAATHPASARAMLEYRNRRLPAARAAARELGRDGARFPWESAGSGSDVTPRSARDRTGRVVRIRTGQLEEHIVAEVAWATCEYVDWSGDAEFANGPALEVLVETARYWASRVRVDAAGAAHIFGVIGPDEYHEPVDDNAFTNVMARWNLRRAADALDAARAADKDAAQDDSARWREIADALVDGYDMKTGIYEQCAGFRGLEPLIISEVAPRRPIAADLWLGAERVQGAQVIKQPDVLMLHHLVPDEVAAGSLLPNLNYYEPRTAHGSSLSPAVHASLFARAEEFPRALHALHLASRIDLDDLTGTTASGLHVATMGGLWQAFVFGFAGIRATGGRLMIDPRLPPSWDALEVRVRFRGTRVCARIDHARLAVTADEPVDLVVGGVVHVAGPGVLEFQRTHESWEVAS
jgi:trehalose/maltose hydrolase-like predicted phosphorylase